jgi:RNA polymerase sigma-70 factor (ECF subfamily)
MSNLMPAAPIAGSREFAELLAAARGGDRAALGKVLTMYRGLLLSVARQRLGDDVRTKLDEADIVQQTLAEAGDSFEQFAGTQPQELAGWLKAALLNNVRDGQRRFESQRRAVGREVSIDADSAIKKQLIGDLDSPSSRMRKDESRQLVEEAMERLSAEYREVLVLRHRENLSFEEIARRLGRSENAVRKLCARAVVTLKEELTEE